MIKEDVELLAAYVRSHSQEAFRELVNRHLPMVYATARRVVGDPQLAEEVAQGAFTTLAQKAADLGSSPVVGGWLYHTTRNLALHALRTEQRRRERERAATALNSRDDGSERTRILEQLEPAMAELHDSERNVLVLRYLQEHSLREVGSQLGISEDAARMRVNRALERLREAFAQRGITVSSLTLAAAMGVSTSALPPSVAAAITATALGEALVASAPLTTMTHSAAAAASWFNAKIVTASLVAVLLAGMVTCLVQHGQIRKLRAYNQALLAQRLEAAADLENASQRANASQDELQRLQRDNAELLRLRNEVSQFRRQQGAAMQLSNSPSPSGVVWSLDPEALARNPPLVLIRPSPDPARAVVGMVSSRGRTIGLSTSLTNIVTYAYDIAPQQLDRLLMPPEAPRGSFDFLDAMPQGGKQALRQLLEDQYGLTAKWETRPVESLQLVVKNAAAAGLKASTRSGQSSLSSPATAQAGTTQPGISGEGMSMEVLAWQLGHELRVPVTDQTGLTGLYDYNLGLKPGSSLDQIQLALSDQLGMSLERKTQPESVEFLVVTVTRK